MLMLNLMPIPRERDHARSGCSTISTDWAADPPCTGGKRTASGYRNRGQSPRYSYAAIFIQGRYRTWKRSVWRGQCKHFPVRNCLENPSVHTLAVYLAFLRIGNFSEPSLALLQQIIQR